MVIAIVVQIFYKIKLVFKARGVDMSWLCPAMPYLHFPESDIININFLFETASSYPFLD